MANIWRKDDSHREQPNRNIIDLSFQNNLTLDFGYLYPVVVQPTIPGDSYEIKPTFALNFESMVFPIQTRMRSYLHFFKVRNRNLWKDWEDFIGKNKQGLVVPYIDESITQARTGKLLDYLGVPTTLVGYFGSDALISLRGDAQLVSGTYQFSLPENFNVDDIRDSIISLQSISPSPGYSYYNQDGVLYTYPSIDFSDYKKTKFISYQFPTGFNSTGIPSDTYIDGEKTLDYLRPSPRESYNFQNFSFLCITENPLDNNSENSIISVIPVTSNKDNLISFDLSDLDLSNYDTVYCSLLVYSRRCLYYASIDGNVSTYHVVYNPPNSNDLTYSVSVFAHESRPEVRDIDETNSPYWRSGATLDLRERIKLRALRPRAYEAIYNSFYRNAENNPFKINGVEEYNKYIPTDEGGLDSNLYELRRRNWEDDFLTTALPMPQAGIAPLVGLTGTAGAATVTIANSNGETVVANAQVDEDGNITSLTTDASSNLASSLLDTVTYGISINDLRNVNAFQRWLEAKARGGYKYRDQIETLFGVTVRYDTLDMPEFIGGMSLDVFVNQITQTVNVSPSSPLGDIAGQASCIGSGERITEYCDEHGYIIGILSVVPVPNYSQLLDKDWFKSDAFDYYFPQFGHIGMQPITYKEVCPVQAFQESTESDNVLEDTFGYQRAWYDYLARTDEVHGHFRTTLRDFVMNRTFDVKPELSESFLLVDNEQLNDVFAITDISVSKIRGQIYFDMKGKRPIPLYGIPKLE